jgi:hypothetical protein
VASSGEKCRHSVSDEAAQTHRSRAYALVHRMRRGLNSTVGPRGIIPLGMVAVFAA